MNAPTEVNMGELIELQSAEQVFDILLRWHDHQINTLKHMQSIPSGTEVQMGEGAKIVLKGKNLEAFKAGIQTAIDLLGTLPFAYIDQDNEQSH